MLLFKLGRQIFCYVFLTVIYSFLFLALAVYAHLKRFVIYIHLERFVICPYTDPKGWYETTYIYIFIGSKSNHGNRLPCLEWSVSLVFKHQNTDLRQVYLLQKEAWKYFLKFIREYFCHQGRIKHSKMSRFILPLTVYLFFDVWKELKRLIIDPLFQNKTWKTKGWESWRERRNIWKWKRRGTSLPERWATIKYWQKRTTKNSRSRWRRWRGKWTCIWEKR